MVLKLLARTNFRENSQKSWISQNLKPAKFDTFKVIQRHENIVTYTIKKISKSEKVWTLQGKMLMPVNHTLQTLDEAPNIYPIKIKLQKKVKSAMRKEAIEQEQKDLSKPSDASESDATPSTTLYYLSSAKTETDCTEKK